MHHVNVEELIQYPKGPVVNTEAETVYISGPISGDLVGNIPAFFDVEEDLLARGHRVFNPARIGGGRNAREAIDLALEHALVRDWSWYMRRSLVGLAMCTTILMLPGWLASTGACIERSIGVGLGMPINALESV